MGALAISGLAMVCSLASLVCSIIIIVYAFQNEGVGEGFLCLCVPFYILYYGFTKFYHPKRGLILGIWLGGIGGNILFQVIGMSLMGGGGGGGYYY